MEPNRVPCNGGRQYPTTPGPRRTPLWSGHIGCANHKGAVVRRLMGIAAALVLLSACSGIGEIEPVPWRLSKVSGNDLAVTAEFGGSSCSEFDQWQVDESDTEVK